MDRPAPTPSIGPALIRARLRLGYNEYFRRPGGRQRLLFLALLGGAFMVVDYLFFARILDYLNRLPLAVGEILIIQLMNTLALTLFSMLLFSNVIASISILYLSRDLEFLISSPLPVGRLFLSRLGTTVVNSSWMALIFGAPIFVAYGEVYYASGWYYLAMATLMGPFFLLPALMGTGVTMVLMRYFPARRTYQVLSFVGLVFIVGLVMFFRFLKPEKYLRTDIPEEELIRFVDTLKTPDTFWLPSATFTHGLQGAAFGDGERWATSFGLLMATSVVGLGLLLMMARSIYLSGWSATHGARESMMPTRERLLYRISRQVLRLLPDDVRGVLLKEIKLFWRETGQWSQLMLLAALVAVYLFNIRNLPLTTLYMANIVSVMNIGLAGIVLAAVTARFAYGAASIEGRSFWVLRAGPINFHRFLWAKYLLYLVPLFCLAEILVVVSNRLLGVDAYVMAVSAGSVGLVTVGLTGMGVGMGGLFPKFDYENVAQIGVTSGAIAYMIMAMVYCGLTVALVSRPVYAHLLFVFRGVDIGGSWIWLHFGGVVLLTMAATLIPMLLGGRSLNRSEV